MYLSLEARRQFRYIHRKKGMCVRAAWEWSRLSAGCAHHFPLSELGNELDITTEGTERGAEINNLK